MTVAMEVSRLPVAEMAIAARHGVAVAVPADGLDRFVALTNEGPGRLVLAALPSDRDALGAILGTHGRRIGKVTADDRITLSVVAQSDDTTEGAGIVVGSPRRCSGFHRATKGVSAPPILIVHASGTNRDGDAAQAIELAGGSPRIVHVNQLRRGRVKVADHAAVLIPGGFSYGDALGAGQRLALELRLWFGHELSEVVAAGKPVLGICNGFQVLVKAGLLPGRLGDDPVTSARRVTLTENSRGKFECRWVTLRVEPTVRKHLAAIDRRHHHSLSYCTRRGSFL